MSTSTFHITKTILGIKNELLGITNIANDPNLDTTLNYKYGVFADETPATKPVVAYFGIGVNGFKNLDDGNLSTPYIPSMENMDLYEPLPFRCVPIDEDISTVERAKYRMRVRKTFNSVDYWCYYLKLLEFTDVAVQITQTDPETLQENPYTLDVSNLTPIPYVTEVDVNGQTGETIEGSEINVSLNCKAVITGEEVLESVGVIYDDPRRAVISELGIYTGVDKVVTGVDYLDNPLQYTEGIYSQLAVHQCSIGTPFGTIQSTKELNIRLSEDNTMLL